MAIDPHSIELTDEQFSQLCAMSASTGKTLGELLQDALRQYVATHPVDGEPGGNATSFADRLANAGLLGCLNGGPDDLSTNPDYMQGFGT